MEAKQISGCSLPSSGSFTFQDDYGVIYEVEWDTTASGLDITTITKQPRIWGETGDGFRDGNVLFRRGLISSHRQIIRSDPDGYVIVSEGTSQQVGYYQSNFPCGPLPTDPFCYHLDCALADEIEALAACGPRWTDPENPDDDIVAWGTVMETAGDVEAVSQQLFQWVDVWGNDDDLVSTCPPGTG